MWKLDKQKLLDMAEGAALLGAGGGGDPYIGRLTVQQALNENKEVTIVNFDEFAGDALVIAISIIGAPGIFLEKLFSADQPFFAIKKLEEKVGKKIEALIATEVGGFNSMIPLFVGAKLGIPVIDADGMGRAFPRMQMITFYIYGGYEGPAVVSNDKGETFLIESNDIYAVDGELKKMAAKMGGIVMAARYPMKVKKMKSCAVLNTLTIALEIGASFRVAKEQKRDPFESLFSYLENTIYGYGKILFVGKVIDIQREDTGAFTVGAVKILGLEGYDGELMIKFQNENLIAYHGNKMVAIVPDIIAILDKDKIETITCENIRYGQRVVVIGIRAPQILQTEQALEILGPKGFELNENYKPID